MLGSDLKRYSVAALAVLAATGLTLAIQPLFGGKAPLVFYTIAVIVTAGFGGFRAGIATTALSLLTIFVLFEQSVMLLVMTQSSLVMFFLVGVAVSVMVGQLHQTNQELNRARQELAQANKKLEQRSDALAQSNDELQRFAYTLAHDLHNPLRSISAMTDSLVRRNAENMDETSREYARLIVSDVDRTRAMIHGLLDYAAAVEESADQTITDCNTVMMQALHDLRYPIETSGAKVTFDRLPAVSANGARLVQVFSNLIANAIKYRGERTPQIHVSAREHSGECVFCVKDNGIGLDMKYSREIFGMFKRLHGAEEYEGRGIGLALCHAVIERHGGRIWVESEPGTGSSFYFTLPRQTPETVRSPESVRIPGPFKAKRAAQL